MKSFARITANKLAPLLTAAAFAVSTPCSAAVLSKTQGLAVGAHITTAEGFANSALGPAAVAQLALAIREIGNGINTMVDGLPAVISQTQAAAIKASVSVAQTTATNAEAQGDLVGRQTLATAFNQLGNAMKQLAQNVLEKGGVIEINGIVDANEALFGGGVASGNTQLMGTATARLADGLGVMVNILTT